MRVCVKRIVSVKLFQMQFRRCESLQVFNFENLRAQNNVFDTMNATKKKETLHSVSFFQTIHGQMVRVSFSTTSGSKHHTTPFDCGIEKLTIVKVIDYVLYARFSCLAKSSWDDSSHGHFFAMIDN